MVSDSLCDRMKLFNSLPSDDESERGEELNDSKPIKKKKRSGSLQGNCLAKVLRTWSKRGIAYCLVLGHVSDDL